MYQDKKYLIVYFNSKSKSNNFDQIILIEYAGKFNRIYISEQQSSDLWYEGYWFTGYNYNKQFIHEHLVTNEFICPRTQLNCQHKFYELEYNFEPENLNGIYLYFKDSLKLSNPNNSDIFEDICFKQESKSIIIYNNKYRDKFTINNSDEIYET